MIGQSLSPVLLEIELAILEHQAATCAKPEYTDKAFNATIVIFMSALMDKMYNLQELEAMTMEDRCNMATKAGEDLRKLVKTYTNIDTWKL